MDVAFLNAKTEIKKLGDIDQIYWLDDKHRFIEFSIEGKGTGIYSVPMKKFLLMPGSYHEISVDEPMGLIFYKKLYHSHFSKINFEGEEILV